MYMCRDLHRERDLHVHDRVSYRERDLHVHVQGFIQGEGFTCTCTGFHTGRGIYMYMYRVSYRERDLHVHVQGFIQGEGFTCTCTGFHTGRGIYASEAMKDLTTRMSSNLTVYKIQNGFCLSKGACPQTPVVACYMMCATILLQLNFIYVSFCCII